MKITIIAVGKIKNKEYLQEINNYFQQIPFEVMVIEIKDEPNKEGVKKEGLKILPKIPSNSFVISLDIKGDKYNSIDFSKHIEKLLENKKEITFIIGGSYGLADEVLERSQQRLSFSDFTFPHQLMRVILAEQLFRTFKIMEKHPYHK